MKIFSYLVIAVVAIAIIAGFFVLGTPQAERMKKFDNLRVNNLQDIQWQVINYWQTKNTLPENLDLLINDTNGTRPPVDPETGESYSYKIVDSKELTFELCANFKTESLLNDPKTTEREVAYMPYGPGDVNWNWQHSVGNVCFERTIDPDQYKPNPEVKEIIVR